MAYIIELGHFGTRLPAVDDALGDLAPFGNVQFFASATDTSLGPSRQAGRRAFADQAVCVVAGDVARNRLASIAVDRNRPQKHIQRARIVLLSDKGLTVAEVARKAEVSRPAVWRWQIRYAQAGVEALLHDKTRPPATAKLAATTVAKILALTRYEKTACSYMGVLSLAAIMDWLRR